MYRDINQDSHSLLGTFRTKRVFLIVLLLSLVACNTIKNPEPSQNTQKKIISPYADTQADGLPLSISLTRVRAMLKGLPDDTSVVKANIPGNTCGIVEGKLFVALNPSKLDKQSNFVTAPKLDRPNQIEIDPECLKYTSAVSLLLHESTHVLVNNKPHILTNFHKVSHLIPQSLKAKTSKRLSMNEYSHHTRPMINEEKLAYLIEFIYDKPDEFKHLPKALKQFLMSFVLSDQFLYYIRDTKRIAPLKSP